MRSIEFLREAAPVNPYTGADAAKFAALSQADQAWLTKGGGKPDINDPYILNNAPNKGRAVAAAQPAAAARPSAAAQPAAAPANPYQGADAARFAALSQADQKELTKDGQKPDINDQYILGRLPNKGKPAAGGNLPAGAPSKPLTWKDSSGNPVQDSSGNPVQAGNPPPASAQEQLAANIAAVRAAERSPEQDMGAGAPAPAAAERSPEQDMGAGAPAPAAAERSPEQDMGAGAPAPAAAPSVSAADQADADMGAAMKANQAAAIGANQDAEDQAMGQAMKANQAAAIGANQDAEDQAMGQAMTANAASAKPAAAQPATGVNAQGQNVTITNPDGSKTNPETGTTTAAAPNYDAMTFNQAFAAARKAGAKDFMWKNKKYAVQMAPQQSATPRPFPAGTVQNAAGGQTTTNAGGAATSVTRNNRPVVPGSLRAQQQANQAATKANRTFEESVDRIRHLAIPASTSTDVRSAAGKQKTPAAKPFEESVDLMRRLTNILKG
jgi:hypothetical protein